MSLHLNHREQMMAIEKVFQGCPFKPKAFITERIIYMEMPDEQAADYYAGQLNKAGWISLWFPNRFCSKAILTIHLHLSGLH